MNTIEQIRQISRRQQLLRAIRLSLIGLLLIIAILFLFAAWDAYAPMNSRSLLLARFGVLTLFVISLINAWKGYFHRPSPLRTAAALEESDPAVGQQLRTAWEVQEQKGSTVRTAEYEQLSFKLARDSAITMTQLDSAPVVGQKKTLLAAGLILVALGFFFACCMSKGSFALALKRCSGITSQTHTLLEWGTFPEYHDDRHPAQFVLQVGGRKVVPVFEILLSNENQWRAVELTALENGVGYDAILTGVETTVQVRAHAGDATLAPRTVPWVVIPRLLDMHTSITYPAYTQLAAEQNAGGDVNAVEGSQIVWGFQFNTTPEKITWQLGDMEPLSITADHQHSAEFHWEGKVTKQTATLSIYDGAGRNLDSWKFNVKIFPDALPTIELLDPAKDMEATSVTEFPARIRARDDFGLAEVGLIMDAAGNREWVLEQTVEVKNDKDINDVISVMLEKVPLSIRDNVRLHAYALDHKPRGGPRAVSALRSVDIKEFKPRSSWGGTASEEPSPKDEARNKKLNELIGKMDQVVKRQREYTSSVFQFSQNGINPEVDAAAKLHGEEDIIHRSIQSFHDEYLKSGIGDADDMALLSAAADQAKSSAKAVLIPDMNNAFLEGDAALASLLELRKSLVEHIMKSNCPCEKPKHQPKSITELAREARRLAKEEIDIQKQLAAGPNERELQAARRQQEVALSDGGELFSEIVAHHERSDGAMELMSESEKLMQAADDKIHQPEASAAMPILVDASVRLNELADFLDAMDLNQIPKTLKKMAEEAAENQKNAQQAENEKPKEGETENDKKERAERQEKAAEQAERKTELARKALKQLADDLAARDGEENEDVKKLRDIIRENDLGKLGEKAGEWKQAERESREPDARGHAGDVAKGMERFAADLLAEAQRREASRLQKLAEAKKQAGELKKELAGGKDKDGKKPGEQAGKGEKPGEKPGEGKGDKLGDKPGEGMAKGEEGKNGKGDKTGDKPGEGKEGKGEKPGDKPGQGMAKGDDGKSGKGGGKSDDKQQQDEKSGGLGSAMSRFSHGLENLHDDELRRIAGNLHNGKFDKNSLPLIEMAESRIDQLIAEIPRPDNDAVVRNRVPESSRREIEDYYRDLSNDIEE